MNIQSKKLEALLDGLPSLQDLGRNITTGQWNGNGQQLGELLELMAELGAKRERWAMRQGQLERAKESHRKTVEEHAEYVARELKGTAELKQRLNGLLIRLKTKDSGGKGNAKRNEEKEAEEKDTSQKPTEADTPQPQPQQQPKPVMVDKEVQVIPERAIFTSPAHINSIRRVMPTSPVLRSVRKEKQRQANLENTSIARSLFDMTSTADSSESKENNE